MISIARESFRPEPVRPDQPSPPVDHRRRPRPEQGEAQPRPRHRESIDQERGQRLRLQVHRRRQPALEI